MLDETDAEDSQEDLEEEKEDQKQSEDMWSDPGFFIDKILNKEREAKNPKPRPSGRI